MIKIIKKKVVFNEKLIVEELRLTSGTKKFTKQRLKRQDAAVVLLLNTDSDKVVLVKQYRYAIAAKTKEYILEAVAGRIDENEKPVKGAIREVKEETGYRIKRANIQLMLKCFSSPGYSSERFFVYYATVTKADKIGRGGGLAKENEKVKIVEMKRSEFIDKLTKAKFKDAKTYVAGFNGMLLWGRKGYMLNVKR